MAVSFERRTTRQLHVGRVPVGGGAPISVQSMTITKTADVEGTLQQIYALAAAGCDIVRCTCNETEAAEGLAQIVPRSPIPIIADIHHQYRMALAAMEAGVHGLRARHPCHLEDLRHVQVRVGGGPRPQRVRLVGELHEQRVAVGLAVHRDRADAHLAQGAHPRQEIAKAVIESGWGLNELHAEGLSLEEIFLQLTGTQASSDPAAQAPTETTAAPTEAGGN